jgi:REP element-mobilizing transposase RayT
MGSTDMIVRPTLEHRLSIETFNLAAPPDFRGLDAHEPVKAYYRHLPHWRQEGATYFVTFRLADALPQQKLNYLKRLREHWERTHPEPRSRDDWEAISRELFRHEDVWLDEGYGACHFRDPQIAAQLEEALMHFQSGRYFISCWVIMPNHCHLVMKPFEDHSLEKILQGIKGVVARRVNSCLGSTGKLWQDESYDRIIRDEEHLWRVIQYIGRNPSKAGLPLEQSRRWIDPSWAAAGWRFVDD